MNASPNVNPSEVAKFEASASRWWDPEGEFRPLHEINPLRLGYIEVWADLGGRKVLDVGCGGGILSESMALKGADVTGIDMGEGPLNVARLHAMESGATVDYQRSTVEELASSRPGTFQVITCMEMLEHVPDPASVVEACARLTVPGGKLFFSTLNRTPKAYLQAIIGAEYMLGMLPRGTHDYSQFIRPSELCAWARAAGLVLRDLTGMRYNPLSRRYSLGKNVDVNYLACFEKPGEDEHGER
ncbi:MAG: bifunctional 2-polyprenyl-6-hydroxyphenol methylase/3-demethylubiquinol 3-O-methyltransferase UbiG [Ectothiorhodospiraceae bacterium]|nr:bifunctional 2-polyprenyl-6-hydroxyphenol methylase/3-demethylubiquinol 3-O-methyltransferase UbiG [Ectothiorhodospiraceae bacterium]MCH8506162.1 bifunctional 2-polyprenyl-6-hydroxyphenol methylase/3-demethylubiquinol 3-O-methyltransferase UbiG [Ectothiorhodospiraceae bacterium]